KGCYFYDRNGWHPTPCASEDFLKAHFGITAVPIGLTSNRFVDAGGNEQLSLVFAQNEVLFPTVGTETDQFRDIGGTAGCARTGTDVPNRFSIQDNTNAFTGNNGDLDAVQFVVQSDGTDNAICVWQIDATLNTAADYHRKCVVPTPRGRPGPLRAFDSGN